MLAARAWIYYAQEKFDESVKYALQAIERKANCEGAYDVLGRAYFSLGRWQDAAALVDRAVEMNGDDYNLYVPYLNALGALGDQEALWRLRVKEMKVLEQQLEMAPEDMRSRILLAVDYAGLNRETEAIRELQKAVALRPNDGNTLSSVYGILKKKAEAMDRLKRAKDSGYSHMSWAAQDPDLGFLHDDQDFQKLVGSSPA